MLSGIQEVDMWGLEDERTGHNMSRPGRRQCQRRHFSQFKQAPHYPHQYDRGGARLS